MTAKMSRPIQQGGSWLVTEMIPDSILTPERLTDEHRLIGQTARQFVENELLPNLEKLENKDWFLARQLLRQCGDLGLLGTDVPESYGGTQLDKAASIVVGGIIGEEGSFGAMFGVQTGLTIMSIRCFGTEEQKQKYLPKLVSGEMVGAYCLSESGSGSDALAAKTRADHHPNGGFVLNGEKMWITNGGFADVFIVFAKLGGEEFTAFIVERNVQGVSSGKEERKMGLYGSSTTSVIFQNAKIPQESLLGNIGKGHKVAFNILNYARFKLGAAATGSSLAAIGEAARYANQRKQFGQAIGKFGAIKHKLGEMTAQAYAAESMIYRVAGLLDRTLKNNSLDDNTTLLAALEDLSVESSIVKVANSEMLNYVLDENIQIHGGNGFVRDYPAEQRYRDSRVNRIFEGTNEINRLLIPATLIRRTLKGNISLIQSSKTYVHEIHKQKLSDSTENNIFEVELRSVSAFKQVALMVINASMKRYGDRLNDEQEVLLFTADIIIDTFRSESAVLRTLQAFTDKKPTAELQAAAMRIVVDSSISKIEVSARQVLATMFEGDALRAHLEELKGLVNVKPINAVELRRRLAEATMENGKYIFCV